MTEQTNIYKKIAQVILHDNTQKIAKSPKGYTSDDVYAALRTAMAENNLVCIPSFVGHTHEDSHGWVNFMFTLVDADSNEKIEATWHQIVPKPNGMMTPDKCIGAASTYAHKYFLMRTFMLTSSDDPKIDDPSGGKQTHSTQKHTSSSNSKPSPTKPAPKPVPKAEKKPDAPSELERLARSPYAKPVYKIEYDTNSRATPRYNAWWKPDADGQPCKIVLFNEHCAEISNALRLDWEAGKNGRYPTRSFNTAIDIFTIWYEKGNYAKFDTVDHSFKSEAVRMRFFEMFERYNPSDLKKALNVENSAEYDGGLSKAIEAVDDYFEGKVDADLQAMDDAPGNVTQIKSAYSQSVEKTKQKQMAGLPAYENLG